MNQPQFVEAFYRHVGGMIPFFTRCRNKDQLVGNFGIETITAV